MRTLDIGLDIDNVLYPWTTVMTRWTERRKGLDPGALDDHALTWNFHKDQWGMSTEEMLGHYAAGVQAGVIFTEGDPSVGSVSAVRRLSAAGHRLHYITNREIPEVSYQHAWQATHRWLHDHGFVVDSLTISADKMAVPTDVFLDDSADNIRDLVAGGHPHPFLWDRPHNALWTPPGATRVHDWHAFERVVSTVAGLEHRAA